MNRVGKNKYGLSINDLLLFTLAFMNAIVGTFNGTFCSMFSAS